MQNAILYRRAEAAIAVRSEFIQIAAHELRTPLTPLSLQVETLLRSSRDAGADAPVARFEADIEATGRYVQRLTSLVDRLLDERFRLRDGLEAGSLDRSGFRVERVQIDELDAGNRGRAHVHVARHGDVDHDEAIVGRSFLSGDLQSIRLQQRRGRTGRRRTWRRSIPSTCR